MPGKVISEPVRVEVLKLTRFEVGSAFMWLPMIDRIEPPAIETQKFPVLPCSLKKLIPLKVLIVSVAEVIEPTKEKDVC